MQVLKTLKPGEPGTKRFLSRYGNRLVAVRYLRDENSQSHLTIIEVIADRRSSSSGGTSYINQHGQRRTSWVKLKIDIEERAIQQAIK